MAWYGVVSEQMQTDRDAEGALGVQMKEGLNSGRC